MTWHFCATVFGPLNPEHFSFCAVCFLTCSTWNMLSHILFHLLQLLIIHWCTFLCACLAPFLLKPFLSLENCIFIEKVGRSNVFACVCMFACVCVYICHVEVRKQLSKIGSLHSVGERSCFQALGKCC